MFGCPRPNTTIVREDVPISLLYNSGRHWDRVPPAPEGPNENLEGADVFKSASGVELAVGEKKKQQIV